MAPREGASETETAPPAVTPPAPASSDAPASVSAPAPIYINGVLGFNEGDAVPAETASRLNLAGYEAGSGPIHASADANGIIVGD